MIRLTMLVVLALVLCAYPQTADSQEMAPASVKGSPSLSGGLVKTDGPKADKIHRMTGKLLAVDLEGKTLRFQHRSRPIIVGFAENTHVRSGRQTRPFSELKEGQKLTIEYRDVAGKKVAQQIRIIR